MAEPLKDSFGVDVIHEIAEMLDRAAATHDVRFDAAAFVEDAAVGFEEQELTSRARTVAAAMAEHLPPDRGVALAVLQDSLGVPLVDSGESGMTPFRYLPHVYFVASEGQDHLDAALAFQREVTKRFTAEFSIRSFLVGPNRDATLHRLTEWTADPDEHVRRLVSEGTRPRLPWAPRLREFMADPSPVLALLERLRHDPSEYVRRSVANNLNDIAKDHPDLVIKTTHRWWADIDHAAARAGDHQAGRERWMIRHALRTLLKQGDATALAILGYDASSPVRVAHAKITPTDATIGERVVVEVTVENPAPAAAAALIDLRVHFVTARGGTSARVFKGAEVDLDGGASQVIRKTIKLNQQSTRTHHPGRHEVEALVNGVVVPLGSFELH